VSRGGHGLNEERTLEQLKGEGSQAGRHAFCLSYLK